MLLKDIEKKSRKKIDVLRINEEFSLISLAFKKY